MYCFDALRDNGPIAYQCDMMGTNDNQQYLIDPSGHIRHGSGKCLDVSHKKLVPGNCVTAATFEQIEHFVSEEKKLYEATIKKYGYTDDMPSK